MYVSPMGKSLFLVLQRGCLIQFLGWSLHALKPVVNTVYVYNSPRVHTTIDGVFSSVHTSVLLRCTATCLE